MFVRLLVQDNAEVTTQRLKQELEGFRGAMSRIEATLAQVAGAAQMETLALVVEEQRRRIDSILTGTCMQPSNSRIFFII